MTRFLIASAAVAALLPAAANADTGRQQFTRDGVSYTYTQDVRADGATLIRGNSSTGGRFRLIVRDGHVSGMSGGKAVSFPVAVIAPVQTASID